jgi:hypothetical protein
MSAQSSLPRHVQLTGPNAWTHVFWVKEVELSAVTPTADRTEQLCGTF